MTRLGLFFTAFLSLVSLVHAEFLQVHFVDVGQGSAVLLETSQSVVLVDAGQFGRARSYLARIGITEIDLIVATHAHADHIGGFVPILESMAVRRVWYNGQTHTTLTFERFIDSVLDSGAPYHEPSRGESISFGDLRITVLHPKSSAADYEGHLHDMGIVVRATYGDFSVLLTGDAEVETEREILSTGMDVDSTILKLGHHGSRTSTSMELLRAVSPAAVVYQAGAGNPYGYPHREVVRRARAFDEIPIYGTDVYGTIVFKTDGVGYSVRVEKAGSAPASTPGASGCIDINSAPLADLTRIIHIGPSRGQELIRLRPFESVDDLTRISGIGPARLRDIKEQGLACVR